MKSPADLKFPPPPTPMDSEEPYEPERYLQVSFSSFQVAMFLTDPPPPGFGNLLLGKKILSPEKIILSLKGPTTQLPSTAPPNTGDEHNPVRKG